jgi:osmoprotectant transport system permease protein
LSKASARAWLRRTTFRPGTLSLPALLVLGIAVLACLPLLGEAPNRLLSGRGVMLATLTTSAPFLWCLPTLLAAGVLVLACLSPQPRRAAMLGALLALATLFFGLLLLAGAHAQQWDAATQGLGRTALGSGFWLAVLVIGLLAHEVLRQLQARLTHQVLYAALVLLGTLGLLASGLLDSLSTMKEYANRDGDFWRALVQHLRIMGYTVVLTVGTGLPLGLWVHRTPAWGRRLFPLLNMVQTIPSIALFGVLMALLAWLGTRIPLLPAWGIHGVGMAPAVLALTLYSLLPLVRSVHAGLGAIPAGIRESAQAMGLSRAQLLWQIELPLALPVVLAGLKVMLVQTIGLTAVAALIGAGGLGTLMFEGLFSSALDLVVLAVIPIVLLAWLAQALFMALDLAARHLVKR